MSEKIQLSEIGDVRNLVKEKYGAAAQTVLDGKGSACCCGSKPVDSFYGGDAITGRLYDTVDTEGVPEAALLASLGCGNPTALAALTPGETVLDLGSGGGIDVLLSAKRVGPTGFAYGLDMTDEMLALAEKNRAEVGAENVRFIKGHIEEIPLPDNSVDVIISNCVINLSADKNAVLKEAFRVLRPGGRFAVSDVVVEGDLPAALRKDLEAYVGCVAGALEKSDYLRRLKEAGFEQSAIEPTRRYTFADLDAKSCCSAEVAGLSCAEKSELDGKIMGAFIRAVKPGPSTEQAAEPCCGSECCTSEAETAASSCCDSTCCTDEAAAAPAEKRIEVFDPPMCCSTGVCGPGVDPALVKFAADLAWLRHNGATVERFNLSQQADEFIKRPEIVDELRSDPQILPIVVVNGQVISRRVYPQRAELCTALGIRDSQISLKVSV